MSKKLRDAFNQEISKEVSFATELLEDVALPITDWNMIHSIVKKYNEYITERKDNDISDQYDIMSLLAELQKIHTDSSLSAEEKIQKKINSVDEFLPTSIFVDISQKKLDNRNRIFYLKVKGRVL